MNPLQSHPSLIHVLGVVSHAGLSQELRALLSDFDLRLFEDISAALADIFASNHIPDVILLDLPLQEARYFSQLLHEDQYLALTPIILIYDKRQKLDPAGILALGATDLIDWPLDPPVLLNLIHKHELTRRNWWETFGIQAPEKPQQLLSRLKTLQSDSQDLHEPFQRFRQNLYQQVGLLPDRIKYLQHYSSEEVYKLGEALYLDSWQMAASIAEFMHMELLKDFEGFALISDALPSAFCRRNLVLPLTDSDGEVIVAVSNPFQLEVMDILSRRFKTPHLMISPPELIEAVLDPEFMQSEHYLEWQAQQHIRLGRPLFTRRQPSTNSDELILRRRISVPPLVEAPAETSPDPEPVSEYALSASEASKPESSQAPADAQTLNQPSITNEREAQQMEKRLFRAYQAYREQTSTQAGGASATDIKALLDSESDPEVAPIIHLVNSLIEKAHLMGASDIHLEPWQDEVLIRYRIDGQLQVMHRLQPQAIIKPLITRIKIMSQLDITEKRLPQDGTIPFGIYSPGHDIHLRVSIVPLRSGEKAVLRLLDSHRGLMPLEQTGFSPATLANYRRVIQAPYGMVLHVGPTGSGKTTTLYAALQAINRLNINISTIENPIEYVLPGINQLQVHYVIGLDFAKALRAYLRQDPDVILVGEIRDEETAHVAVEAAMTGHLLFSTLHTNDAASTVIRLREMGIQPYMISSSLLAICAQRLLRKLCLSCREPYLATREICQSLGLPTDQRLQLYRAHGCEQCQEGYHGRIGIYELMLLNDDLREVINEPGLTSERLKAAAIRLTGMSTLYQEGLSKVLSGLTSLEELTLKVLPDRLSASAVVNSKPANISV